MSGQQQIRSSCMDGILTSLAWCDVFNFLVGVSCIINGFGNWPNKEMLVLVGKVN